MSGGRAGINPPKTKIFVGRLPENAKAPELRRLFEKFGVVTECDILNRYGFVHMETEDMAARAIGELDNSEFMGAHISVEASTGKKGGRSGKRGGGGGGPMRGRGGMRGGRGPPSYMRDRGDFERRGPPPAMRNGYGYDNYERSGYGGGGDSYGYGGGRPAPSMMAPRGDRGMYGDRRPPPPSPYERRPYPEMGRAPPSAGYDRRPAVYESRAPAAEMFQRRSPPSAGYGGMGGGYDREPMDPYMQRRYPAPSPLGRDMPPVRRF